MKTTTITHIILGGLALVGGTYIIDKMTKLDKKSEFRGKKKKVNYAYDYNSSRSNKN